MNTDKHITPPTPQAATSTYQKTILRTTAILLIVIFLFFLVACTNGEQQETQEAATPPGAAATSPPGAATEVAPGAQETAPSAPADTEAPTQAPTPTEATGCTLWSDVSLDDVGLTMCVYGQVNALIFEKESKIGYVFFDENSVIWDGEFLLISYSYKNATKFNQAVEKFANQCIQVEGLVEATGETPVIVVPNLASSLRICSD